jgi:hypothetical protein
MVKTKKLNKEIVQELEDLGIDLMPGPLTIGYCLYCRDGGETYPIPEVKWWSHCVQCGGQFPRH